MLLLHGSCNVCMELILGGICNFPWLFYGIFCTCVYKMEENFSLVVLSYLQGCQPTKIAVSISP
jgi:hypothetical protein